MAGMKRFRVLIDTKRAGTIEEEIEALNALDAAKACKKKGTVLSVKRKWGFKIQDPLSRNDRISFMTRLAGLQSARVGASESLSLLGQFYKGPIKRVSTRMLAHIESGSDIAEAMERIGPPDFPQHITALVKAGSKGGETGKAIDAAVEFEKKLHEIKRQSSGGIWSGLGGFVSALGITLGTTEYFGPMVLESDLMKIGGDAIDVGWAETLADWSSAIMIGLTILMLVLFALGSVGRLTMPSIADKIILKIPFYKDLVLAKNNYVILFGLSQLVGTGVPMDQALKLQAEAAPKGAMRDDLEAAWRAVKSGRPWAMAMKNLHPTDKAALSTSQDKEQVARALDAMSRQYQILFAQRIATLGPVLQLIAVSFLVLSGIILFGMTIVPMFQLSAGGLA